MSNFQREQKYLVVRWEDIDNYLSRHWRGQLDLCLRQIDQGRASEGKKINQYVVVNQDEPYIETIWKALEVGEDTKVQ